MPNYEYLPSHRLTRADTHTHTSTHAFAHACTHTHTETYTYTDTDTDTYTYTYTYTWHRHRHRCTCLHGYARHSAPECEGHSYPDHALSYPAHHMIRGRDI